MRTPVARKLLGQMIEGEELDERDLRELVATPGESLYVDFKDGTLLDEHKKARETVRQYVAGFANADGGILVVGVSDGGGDPANRRFTPTKGPGGHGLAEWVRTVLAPLAGGLIPPPRIQVVTVEGVEVLVIGVARAPALVPCAESGELRYYLRLGDSTLAISPYLISDLILGRREHPRLEVRVRERTGSANGPAVRFGFEVENESMVPANDVVVGVISWGLSPGNERDERSAPHTLRGYISALEPVEKPTGKALTLAHVTSRTSGQPLNFHGFEVKRVLNIGDLLVPRPQTPVPMRAALYVIASGHPPEWYQFDWLLPAHDDSTLLILIARAERVGHERPVVAWNQEWRDSPDNAGQA